ncbi:MAG TPA: hypothetical protein VHE30_26955 [Polyangiaceae bacterium]|nr:hypothetical protein [Polyangiaceae bacterium]
MRTHFPLVLLVPALALATAGCSCSSESASDTDHAAPRGRGTDGGRSGTDGGRSGTDGGGFLNLDAGSWRISPSPVALTVNPSAGKPDPVQFSVSGNATGVTWRLSNSALGYIDQNGLFTPNGAVGGVGEVQVLVGGKVVGSAPIQVVIAAVQNGGTPGDSTDAGAGGLGGVGGEGFGGAVSDDVLAVLKAAASADAGLAMLYPYDQTVFPLDLLPPLFQWTPAKAGPIDAIAIHLSSPPYFDYVGYFGRPAALAAGTDFVRHPIPRDVWRAATLSAAGSTLAVEITVASGGKAYGPMKQSYKIALAPINGIIYYQAYNTAFVQNFDSNAIWGGRFGGATLSIQVGADAPKLVAGKTSADRSGCRVCHSVSAYGDRMVVQHENGPDTSSYDLKNGNTETTPYATGTVGWAGLSPDGTLGLANSIDLTNFDSNDGDTKLYDMTTGAVVPSPGLNEFATQIGLPSFSPDGKHVAFSLWAGPGGAGITPNDGHDLVAMDFDPATKTFSHPVKLWTAPGADQRPAFNSFLPDSSGVVFQRHFKGDNDDPLASWYGARSELWWVDLATKTAVPLANVNGLGPDGRRYVPTGPNDHGTDETLNYEPSISPVGSGGYAWMVFMSRRLYGNVATSDPWASDPRTHDTRVDYTTKKIWMAAIDLQTTPGKDPSHPAFYIPGQELQGSNSRPFFSLSPCVTDRGTCTTGIDCCTGFCRDGLCVPPPADQCSRVDEKCTTTSDCCADSHARCVGGFCSVIVR